MPHTYHIDLFGLTLMGYAVTAVANLQVDEFHLQLLNKKSYFTLEFSKLIDISLLYISFKS